MAQTSVALWECPASIFEPVSASESSVVSIADMRANWSLTACHVLCSLHCPRPDCDRVSDTYACCQPQAGWKRGLEGCMSAHGALRPPWGSGSEPAPTMGDKTLHMQLQSISPFSWLLMLVKMEQDPILSRCLVICPFRKEEGAILLWVALLVPELFLPGSFCVGEVFLLRFPLSSWTLLGCCGRFMPQHHCLIFAVHNQLGVRVPLVL